MQRKVSANVAKAQFSDPARQDLDHIWTFIATESLTGADRALESIRKCIELLASNPFLGRSRSEYGADLRSLVVDAFVVFYTPSAEGVLIVRIVRGERDIDAIFQ